MILVIIGISVAGFVQGQQLVASARTRAVIAQQEKAVLALLGFQDRFRALPGDYALAVGAISGVTLNGNGNGVIELAGVPNATAGVPEENILAWDHVSKAGFVSERYQFSTTDLVSALPRNIYGGYADIAYDNWYGNPAVPRPDRHNVKSGNLIPVEILYEMDNKVDDGNAMSGVIRFSDFVWPGAGAAPPPPSAPNGCTDAGGTWRMNLPQRQPNCGVASFF